MKIFFTLLFLSSCSLFQGVNQRRDIQTSIQKSLAKNQSAMRQCFQKLFSPEANKIRERIALDLSINKNGELTALELFSQTPLSKKKESTDCLFEVLEKVEFFPKGQVAGVEFRQPYLFTK